MKRETPVSIKKFYRFFLHRHDSLMSLGWWLCMVAALLLCYRGVDAQESIQNRNRDKKESNNHKSSPKGDDHKKCTEKMFKRGQWVHGASKCGLAAVYANPIRDSSLVPNDTSISLPYPFSDWCWQPHNCSPDIFNVDAFCRRLRGRRILVVGDSVQHEFYVALFHQLQARGNHRNQHSLPHADDQNGLLCDGRGGGRLEFVRSDQIAVSEKDVSSISTNTYTERRHIYNRDWKLLASDYSILLLN